MNGLRDDVRQGIRPSARGRCRVEMRVMHRRLRAPISALACSALLFLSVNALPEVKGDSAQSQPLSRAQILGLLAGEVSNRRIATLVKARGLDFQPTPRYLRDLRRAGADRSLLATVRSAPVNSTGRHPATTSEISELEESCLTKGARLIRQRLYRQAERRYRAGLRATPDDPTLQFALAYALEAQGKWPEAAAEYRAMLRADPNNPFAGNNLAVTLAKGGNLDTAIEHYHRALAAEPNSAILHDNLGLALQKNGDLKGAIAEFRKAIKDDPRDSHAHNNFGICLEARGDLNGALQEYRRALQLDGGCCQAQYNIGRVLERKGDLNGALSTFQAAVAERPDDAQTHYALGTALERKDDYRGALEQYRRAHQLAPDDSTIEAAYAKLQQTSPSRR
jgi:Flp pilus assembly protein TadD